MSKKYKCFWCNKKFVDLEKHTKNKHPKLTARSYDYIDEDLTYNGDDFTIKQLIPNYTMNFNREDGGKVAELDWNDGTLKFSGNIEKSAELFLEFLKPYLDEYVANKLNDAHRD